MRKIYFAGRIRRREELQKYAQEVRNLGLQITSRWLDPNYTVHANRDNLTPDQRRTIASNDLYDVYKANTVIWFTEPPDNGSNGGRHFEAGFAYGLDKDVWVVGPQENLFCCLKGVRHFKNWHECFCALHEEHLVNDTSS